MDEELFLASLVAAGTEESPRHRYAEWLAERDDSRSAYLHAEMTWARSREQHAEDHLRQLAAKLDPVWIARVSRPPVGVCVDHVRFSNGAGDVPRPSLTAGDLDRFERRFRLTLPADYRGFLLNRNGGIPEPSHFRVPGHPYEEGRYDQTTILLSLWPTEQEPAENDLDLMWMMQFVESVRTDAKTYRDETVRWQGQPHGELMVIGYAPPYDDLTWLCLGCRGQALGKVFLVAPYLMDGFPDYRLVADSFARLLRMWQWPALSQKPHANGDS